MSVDSPNLSVLRQPPAALDAAMRRAETDERARYWLGLAATAVSLVAMSRRRRRLPAALLLLASTAMFRAASGHQDLTRFRAWIERLRERHCGTDGPVTSAAEDSFPASDPPSWTPSVGSVERDKA